MPPRHTARDTVSQERCTPGTRCSWPEEGSRVRWRDSESTLHSRAGRIHRTRLLDQIPQTPQPLAAGVAQLNLLAPRPAPCLIVHKFIPERRRDGHTHQAAAPTAMHATVMVSNNIFRYFICISLSCRCTPGEARVPAGHALHRTPGNPVHPTQWLPSFAATNPPVLSISSAHAAAFRTGS